MKIPAHSLPRFHEISHSFLAYTVFYAFQHGCLKLSLQLGYTCNCTTHRIIDNRALAICLAFWSLSFHVISLTNIHCKSNLQRTICSHAGFPKHIKGKSVIQCNYIGDQYGTIYYRSKKKKNHGLSLGETNTCLRRHILYKKVLYSLVT